MVGSAVARTNMVNGQIITVGITNIKLIAAFLAVPRERFVPACMASLAYIDSDVLLKEATLATQARYLMAAGPFSRLVQEAEIDERATVLDIGCATGYSSAILAQMANLVVALEADKGLAALATKTLLDLGARNVAVVTGPLQAGWPASAQYDVIVISGGVEMIPPALIKQLKTGGRLAAIVGDSRLASGMIYTKGSCVFNGRRAFDAAASPLPGFAKPKRFDFNAF